MQLHATPLEAFWVLIMLLGMAFMVWLFSSALADNRARIREGVNGEMALIAHGTIRWAALLGATFFFLASVGVVALFLPAHTIDIDKGSPMYGLARFANIWNPLALCIAGALLVVMAGLEYRDKRRLLFGTFSKCTEAAHAVHGGEPDIGHGRSDGGGH